MDALVTGYPPPLTWATGLAARSKVKILPLESLRMDNNKKVCQPERVHQRGSKLGRSGLHTLLCSNKLKQVAATIYRQAVRVRARAGLLLPESLTRQQRAPGIQNVGGAVGQAHQIGPCNHLASHKAMREQ